MQKDPVKAHRPTEAETESTTLCRAFKKAIKDGVIDDIWDEVGDHHVFTFRCLKPAVICVSRYESGRKKRYDLHIHTDTDVEADVTICGFDYEHRNNVLKLIFDVGDGHTISFRKRYDE